MSKIKIHINYLYIYVKKIRRLTHELSTIQTEAEVTADADDVQEFNKALDELKTVLSGLKLA